MPGTRIAFADANWIVAAYHVTRENTQVERWRDIHDDQITVISEAVLAECRCNFWRIGNRFSDLESDCRGGLFQDCGLTFAEMTAAAEPLFRRYAPRCNIGTLDLLHIAAAKHSGCRWFLSFDTRSGCRAVAAAEKLKVFPELTSADKRLLEKLR